MIQCARIAFSYGGIYDEDEAERIIERDMGPAHTVAVEEPPAGPPPYPDAQFAKNLPAWTDLIQSSKKTAAQVIAIVSSKAVLSDEQKAAINAITKPEAPAARPDDDFVAEMEGRQPGEEG